MKISKYVTTGNTHKSATPDPFGIYSPTGRLTESIANIGLKELSANTSVSKQSSLRTSNDNIVWDTPKARSFQNASLPNFRPSQPSSLRPSMLTRSGPDLGTILRTSNVLQPFQEANLGQQQLPIQVGESAARASSSAYYHRYDPDQPGFSLEQFKNPYSKKYRCAFPGCT